MNDPIINSPIFSLSRFFRLKKPKFPCYVAGRFYPNKSNVHQLKSQGLKIDFEKQGLNLEKNCWLAIELISKKKNIYQIGSWEVLSKPQISFKETHFSYKEKGQTLKDWGSFLSDTKRFFKDQGVAHTPTPSLVKSPGTEPYLYPFKTEFSLYNKNYRRYLPTSPEMHLKKLLCQDWTDFFEIKQCFRNEELSQLHQPEFLMLEWYRAFYTLKELMEETYNFLVFLKKQSYFKVPLPKAKIYTVQQLFKKELQFDLQANTSKEELISLLKKHKLSYSKKDTFEDVFFNLFLNCIEAKLPKKTPVFIYNYPVKLRAFSKLNKDSWAERFELYWYGFELANAFYEVNDSKEQLSLFKEHLHQRKDKVPLDEELVKLMDYGMPPCSGVALGLDRLFLALYKKTKLTETRLFPFDIEF